ncbi:MAG: hypothetical protein Tsb0014_42400 [Pleurocapsa sp.]
MLSKSVLQQVWLVIEKIKTEEIYYLSDSDLIEGIHNQLVTETSLTKEEIIATYQYIQSRIPLIRDLAEVRANQVQSRL